MGRNIYGEMANRNGRIIKYINAVGVLMASILPELIMIPLVIFAKQGFVKEIERNAPNARKVDIHFMVRGIVGMRVQVVPFMMGEKEHVPYVQREGIINIGVKKMKVHALHVRKASTRMNGGPTIRAFAENVRLGKNKTKKVRLQHQRARNAGLG